MTTRKLTNLAVHHHAPPKHQASRRSRSAQGGHQTTLTISQKVLASTLRDLQENGFVSRTVTPVAPPQVEYALTEFGREFLVPVWGLAEWVLINSARMDAARAAYAKAQT